MQLLWFKGDLRVMDHVPLTRIAERRKILQRHGGRRGESPPRSVAKAAGRNS